VEEQLAAKLASIYSKYPNEQPLVKLKLRGTLSKGFTSSQIDVHPIQSSYNGKLNLSIDREIGSLALSERIEKLRKERADEKSSYELGISFLKKRLAEVGMAQGELPTDVEEIFQLLSNGQIDAAVDMLAPNAEKKNGEAT
jgi:hypothetical protein